MRISKKDIYAMHGVTFNGDKILSPLGFINPVLKNGNTKVGKDVWTFSILPGTGDFYVEINGKMENVKGTCVCDCIGCYAKAGRYNGDTVIKSMAINTIIAREYLDFMTDAIIAQIKADKIRLCRIHAAGDFFSNDYVNAWRKIVMACPETVFWTYTKNHDAENAFDDISNCNIVKSVIPNIGINYGHCDYVLSVYETLKEMGESVYLCRCGFDPEQHCVNCRGCSEHKYVLFLEHSTAYKAEKDPLYPVLYALAMGDNNKD